MVYKLADNIISPLGATTADNYLAIKSGRSALRLYESAFGLPEPFFGSLFSNEQLCEFSLELMQANGWNGQSFSPEQLTKFELLCVLSILRAVPRGMLRLKGKRIKLFLSSTKGNVELLQADRADRRYYLPVSAKKIATFLGLTDTPVVVSNACISGVSAQIAAYRAIESGRCDYAIVVGCDVLSKFIVSGFQSFKALSESACRPFDKERSGLNLGEAVATLVLGNTPSLEMDKLGERNELTAAKWHIEGTSIHNDANHISGPSRTGEGAFRVLCELLQSVDAEQLAFINAHGTATLYNDEMEAIAIHRAGLEATAVNALKGFYGHTLGAAGVVETILSMAAVDDATILGTVGYGQCGTSYRLNILADNRTTSRTSFIKILSGFGGSNAGVLWMKGGKV